MDVQLDGDVMSIRRSAARQNRDMTAAGISIGVSGALFAAAAIAAWHIAEKPHHTVGWMAEVPAILLIALMAAWLFFGALSAFRLGLRTGKLPLILDRGAGEYRRGDTRLGELTDIASVSVEPATPRARDIIRVYAHTSSGVLHAIPDEHAHYRPEDHAGELGGLIAEFLRVPFTECHGCSGSLK
jgi:hypothetical protein